MAKGKIQEILEGVKNGKYRSLSGGTSRIITPDMIFDSTGVPEEERFSFKVKPFSMRELNQLEAIKAGAAPMARLIKQLGKMDKTLSDLYYKDENGKPTGEMDKDLLSKLTDSLNEDIEEAAERGDRQELALKMFVTHVIFPDGEIAYGKIEKHIGGHFKMWLYNTIIDGEQLTFEEAENLK
jgi:hypothetical protein